MFEYIFGLTIFLILLGIHWLSTPEKKKETKSIQAELAPSVQSAEENRDKAQGASQNNENGRERTMHTAVEAITEVLERNSIKYRIIEKQDTSFIETWYNIDCGPSVRIVFISSGNKNDVQIRIYGIMNKIPTEKRSDILEACNQVNGRMRFFKFFVDEDNDLMGFYDLPAGSANDNVGKCCFELLIRAVQILNDCYHYFPEAVYGSSAKADFTNTLSALKYLRDHPIQVPKTEPADDNSC